MKDLIQGVFSLFVIYAIFFSPSKKSNAQQQIVSNTYLETTIKNKQDSIHHRTIDNDNTFYILIGKVINIIDGDTVAVLIDNKSQKIVLKDIDAPEKSQDFGQKSKKELSNLIIGKTVEIHWKQKDKYERILGTIFLDDININQEQVKNGMAWTYRKYTKKTNEINTLINLEKNAKQHYLGIWSQPNPISPWDYRQGVRKTIKPTIVTTKQKNHYYINNQQPIRYEKKLPKYKKSYIEPKSNSNQQKFTCSIRKRFCKQMYSCEEAYFYLEECGIYRLDRDRDSVPCESICGHY